MGPVIFGLGANLGDREATLLWALRELGDIAGPLEVASPYRSVALSSTGRFSESSPGALDGKLLGHPDYLNTVAAGRLAKPIDARVLLWRLKDLERRAGRESAVRDAPRPLDIDVLMAGDLVLDLPPLATFEEGRWPGALRIPHLRMAERRFVLEPLAELAPEMSLPPGLGPSSGRTIGDRLAELGESQEVERIRWSDSTPFVSP